jgi:UDP-N-acetyl-alpha-D-muramoyl-L-alanyl-L-glutamate epimerase
VTITAEGSAVDDRRPPDPDRPGGLVVPIGGGKDSMVLIEALRPLGPRLLAVNPHPLVVELAAQAGLELLVVRRRLSPLLASINAHGALNGHVPITAIVSLIAVAAGSVYGYDTVAMAIERSASEETVSVDGVPVNHQYSKSLEFERSFRDLVHGSIDPGFTYGSALRPYSELAIARAFAALPGYHPSFCSCNTAFRQSAGSGDRWCGSCAKCRFVALMLAPYLSRPEVTDIIGRDMFADPAEIAGFAALMSRDDKPFECVGERRESAAAFRLLADRPEWSGSAVVTALADRARTLVSDQDVASLLAPAPDLAFPDPEVAAAVDRFFTPAP